MINVTFFKGHIFSNIIKTLHFQIRNFRYTKLLAVCPRQHYETSIQKNVSPNEIEDS